MYKSSIRSLVVGGICFVLSLLFNGSLINITSRKWNRSRCPFNPNEILVHNIILHFHRNRSANAMELRGKPSALREIIIIGVMAIIQGILSLPVFLISLVGDFICYIIFMGCSSSGRAILNTSQYYANNI